MNEQLGQSHRAAYHRSSDIEDHDPVLDAEDTNRTRFESRTFIGNTDGTKALLDLDDGEAITFKDTFNRGIFGEIFDIAPVIDDVLGRLTTIGDVALNPSTYVAFGRDEILSQGGFEVTREGDRLKIRGKVRNGFDTDSNVFDFHGSQPGAASARILEDHQAKTSEFAAAPFRMQFDRRQDIEAELRYDGDELILERVKWSDIK